jgi:hypothetical protein
MGSAGHNASLMSVRALIDRWRSSFTEGRMSYKIMDTNRAEERIKGVKKFKLLQLFIQIDDLYRESNGKQKNIITYCFLYLDSNISISLFG